MSMDTDLAMANLSLAGIYMQKRRKREATLLINKAKKLDDFHSPSSGRQGFKCINIEEIG